MSKTKKILFSLSAMSIVVLSFSTFSANAKLPEGGNKTKQLLVCSVSSGGVATQIGNTCSGEGHGCTPNPCGE